jgi:hypothetical protein
MTARLVQFQLPPTWRQFIDVCTHPHCLPQPWNYVVQSHIHNQAFSSTTYSDLIQDLPHLVTSYAMLDAFSETKWIWSHLFITCEFMYCNKQHAAPHIKGRTDWVCLRTGCWAERLNPRPSKWQEGWVHNESSIIGTRHQILSGRSNEGVRFVGHVVHREKMKNAYRILVTRPQG